MKNVLASIVRQKSCSILAALGALSQCFTIARNPPAAAAAVDANRPRFSAGKKVLRIEGR